MRAGRKRQESNLPKTPARPPTGLKPARPTGSGTLPSGTIAGFDEGRQPPLLGGLPVRGAQWIEHENFVPNNRLSARAVSLSPVQRSPRRVLANFRKPDGNLLGNGVERRSGVRDQVNNRPTRLSAGPGSGCSGSCSASTRLASASSIQRNGMGVRIAWRSSDGASVKDRLAGDAPWRNELQFALARAAGPGAGYRSRPAAVRKMPTRSGAGVPRPVQASHPSPAS